MGPLAQAAQKSCLGLGGQESVAFPVEGAEQGKEGRGPGRDFLHSLEVRFVFCLRFLLNGLVGRAWMATGGAGYRAGLGSLGGWSLPPGLPLAVLQLQAPSLVGGGSALANRRKPEHPSCQGAVKYL